MSKENQNNEKNFAGREVILPNQKLTKISLKDAVNRLGMDELTAGDIIRLGSETEELRFIGYCERDSKIGTDVSGNAIDFDCDSDTGLSEFVTNQLDDIIEKVKNIPSLKFDRFMYIAINNLDVKECVELLDISDENKELLIASFAARSEYGFRCDNKSPVLLCKFLEYVTEMNIKLTEVDKELALDIAFYNTLLINSVDKEDATNLTVLSRKIDYVDINTARTSIFNCIVYDEDIIDELTEFLRSKDITTDKEILIKFCNDSGVIASTLLENESYLVDYDKQLHYFYITDVTYEDYDYEFKTTIVKEDLVDGYVFKDKVIYCADDETIWALNEVKATGINGYLQIPKDVDVSVLTRGIRKNLTLIDIRPILRDSLHLDSTKDLRYIMAGFGYSRYMTTDVFNKCFVFEAVMKSVLDTDTWDIARIQSNAHIKVQGERVTVIAKKRVDMRSIL